MIRFAWNGIFVMGISAVAWTLALKTGSTAKIANLAYITPFLSLVWTFLILHEPIEPTSLIGLSLIVVGISTQLKEKQRKTVEQIKSKMD